MRAFPAFSDRSSLLRRYVRSLSLLFHAILIFAIGFVAAAYGQVTTYHYNNSRTGATTNETILNTSNVNVNTFGKLFSLAVDGEVYAQQLYMPNVTIPNQGVHNVVFVATMNNSVFAFDADKGGNPLWQTNLGTPMPTTVCCGTRDILGVVGILSTPVIDPNAGILYVVTETYKNNVTAFTLHALNITTGLDVTTPAIIQGSVTGTAPGSSGGIETFTPIDQWQRSGLLLANGQIYIGFGSHQDTTPYNGWVFSYNATTLAQTGVFCVSPNGGMDGVWQGGVGLAADANGYVYFETGNGPFDVNTGGLDYGDSVVKLSTSSSGLKPVDYFTPSTQLNDDINDWDLGSAGVLLIPGTNLAATAGKDGLFYIVNTGNLGKYNSAGDQVVQEWQATYSFNSTVGGFWGGNYLYYNSTLYGFGERDYLKAWPFNGTQFATTPSSQSSFIVPSGFSNDPGMSISANGTVAGTGIVWAAFSSNGIANGSAQPGVFYAFDASNVANVLWNSNQNSTRDYPGNWSKWSPPIVVNGKVYLPTFDSVVNVYGLLSSSTTTGGTLTGSGTTSSTTANLTSEGNADWVHWGDSSLNRKKGVNAQISNYSLVGSGSASTYNNDPRGMTWSDGTPTATATGDANGVEVTGLQNGVSFTAPADTSSRSLTVHVGGSGSGGTLTASLSDGSAPNFVATTSTVNGQYDENYTLNYSAASAGQTLTVSWVMSSGTGNVTLSGAALSLSGLKIAATAGASQSAAENTSFGTSLQAEVSNSSGAPVSGVAVTFAAPSSAATATFSGAATATAVTSSSGIATAPTLTANGQAGSYTVSATAPGAGSSAGFTLTNTAPPVAASIAATAGATQSATVSTAFGTPLQVTVLTAGGAAVSGASVTFTAPATGASGSFGGVATATAITNASGVATAPTLTANSTAGSYSVTAAVAGVATPASFSLTNVAPVAASIAATAGATQSATVSTAFGTPLQVTVLTAGGAAVSGASVTFTAPATGASGSFGGVATATAITNASGVATAPTLTANSTAGSYSVTAAVAGVATPASFSLTNVAGGGGGGGGSGTTAALSGSQTTSNATVNVTTEGTADWVHWGDGALNRKSGVTAQISTYSVVGSGTVFTYNNDPRGISWSDGTPTAAATADTNGIFINNTGNGFKLTVPAGTTKQVLTVHVGGWNSGGTLTASLGDGSAANFVSTTATVSGQYDENYTLTYTAGSITTLTVTWVMSSGTGNVTLNGAALASGGSNTAASIAATAGATQSATVSTAFGTPLQVTVLTAGGAAVSGASVTFTAPATGASGSFGGVATATAITNASGVATAPTLTANSTAGSYSVTAAVAGVATPASFSLTNVAPVAASIAATAGATQSATVSTAFGTPLQVTVLTAGGAAVSGASVTFTAPATGASGSFGGVATATAITNASGVATAPTLTANSTAGSYSVTAAVAGVATPATFSLTNVAPVAASIAATAGATQSATVSTAFGTPLQVTVLTAGGAAVSGASVTFTAPATGASGSFGGVATATAITNASGVATAPTLTANSTAGSYSVTAAVAGVATPASFSLTNVAGGGGGGGGSGTTAALSGSQTTSNATVNVTTEGTADWVHWGDGALNRKSGVTAQISTYSVVGSGTVFTYNNDPRGISWSDGTPTAAATADTNGIFINNTGNGFKLTVPAGTTKQVLTVHVGGWNSGGTLTASLGDGSAANFVSTTATVSGQYDENYTLTYTAGSITTLTVTWVMSSGTGNVTLNGAALASGGSNTAASIAATAGATQSATVSTAFGTPLQVTVLTAGGAAVSGASVTFTAPATGASGSFGGVATATAITNASGVATAPTLTANSTAGSYSVTAAVAGVATPASFSLTNVAPVAASIAATAGATQSATVSTAFGTPLQVTVLTAGGAAVSGASVTFTAPATGASGSFGGVATATAITNASGVATAPTLTANSTAGSYSVTAAVAGVATPATFSLTNVAPVAASIAATAGATQSATVSTAFGTPLQVTVLTAGGAAVSGASVTFTAPATGASGSFGGVATATAITNASGVATAPTLTANSTAGSYSVTAAVAGVATPASFSLTNVAGGGGGGGGSGTTAALSGSQTTSNATVNVTTEGTADWVHWGDGALNRKSGVTAQISTYSVVGSGTVFTYNNDPRGISWSDGTPTAAATADTNGIFINNTGNGFKLTVPAGTTKQVLTVHVGGWNSGGTLTASLGDGSAANFVSTTATVSGQYDENYTLTYTGGSITTLTVTWVMSSGTGNVTLNGAALSGSSAVVVSSTGTLTASLTTATATANLTSEGALDWVQWGDITLNRKSGVTAQISTYSVVGPQTVYSYSNDPRGLSWSDGTPTATAAADTDGVFITDTGNGFSFTVPASATTRVLTIHVGGYDSGGTLTASLGDGSAATLVNTTATASGAYDVNYTLTYSAGTTTTLTVTWVMSSGTGNVTLNAAALSY